MTSRRDFFFGGAYTAAATLGLGPQLALMTSITPAQAGIVAGAGGTAAKLTQGRAMQAVIWGMPAVNYDLMLQAMLKAGAKENEVVYWGKPSDWRNQTLTPNPDAIYLMTFFNTKDVGPVVIEVPAAGEDGSITANIDDLWQMPLEDAGPAGADKGEGGRYLVLPPGYASEIPDRHIVLRPGTYAGYALLRSTLKSHDQADVDSAVAYGKRIQVYPLSAEAGPPPTRFTDVQDQVIDSTIKYDASFFTSLNRIIQSEPWLERDRAMIDPIRTLGIEKGKPFSPASATTSALDAGAEDARLWLDAQYDASFEPFFAGSRWALPVPAAFVKELQSGYSDSDQYFVDARGVTYTFGFIGIKRLGSGQTYLIAIKDKDGASFDGGKTYQLRVPPNVPVEQYWSVTVYDRVTHALVKNMARASRASTVAELQANADGSVDIWFGPAAPAGKDSNWVPTDPNRPFELMFRLYRPTPALFDKSWTLPDVEDVTG